MIKSIKLANSYSSKIVGFIAKDLSNLYNLGFKLEFSTIILNSLFEELIADNSIKNKISSLMQNLNKDSLIHEIKDACESIRKSILECTFSENLDEHISDAYETLSWGESSSAKDLLNEAKHRVDIIASPDYITIPIIYSGIDREKIREKIKEIYTEFFTYNEVIYRINSNIDHEFSIALLIKKEETFSASAFVYLDKQSNLVKVFVFPGRLNIKDVINPDEEVKPDYYEINRDTLKLKNSLAGKQKFRNISENGEYKRIECQINNFILDDNAVIELARLTKKASVLLEKEVQIIFSITSNTIEIEHVSNIIDLQKDYVQKSQDIIKEEIESEIEPIPEEIEEELNKSNDLLASQEPIIKDPDLEDIPHHFEPELQEEIQEPKEIESVQDNPPEQQSNDFEKMIKSDKHKNINIFGHQNLDTTTSSSELDLNSDKPLSELMQEQETTMQKEPQQEEYQPEKLEENILDSTPIDILGDGEEKKENQEDKKDDKKEDELKEDDFIL